MTDSSDSETHDPHNPEEPEPTQWLLSAFSSKHDHREESHEITPAPELIPEPEPESEPAHVPVSNGFDAILRDESLTESINDTDSFSWSLSGSVPSKNPSSSANTETVPTDTAPLPVTVTPAGPPNGEEQLSHIDPPLEPNDRDSAVVEPPNFQTSLALLNNSRHTPVAEPAELPQTAASVEGPQLSGGLELLPNPQPATPTAQMSRRRELRTRQPLKAQRNRTVSIVLGIVAVALVLLGLFVLGTRLTNVFRAAPQPSPTPTVTPTPTVSPRVSAAVGAGEHPWSALGGGECLQPFTTAWAPTFQVVDCATPHTAQLLYTNLLSADPAAPYPGEAALTAQVTSLCHVSGLVNLTVARAYTDLEIQVSFPASAAQWKAGQRSYYCFISRSGGATLTGSLAGSGPAQ